LSGIAWSFVIAAIVYTFVCHTEVTVRDDDGDERTIWPPRWMR